MEGKETFKDKLSKLPAEAKAALKELFSTPVITPTQNAAPAIVDPNAAPAPDLVLEDGTVIKIDTPTLAEGSNILVVTPEGELPAPDGTHKLKTGEEIEVSGGKVVKLTPAAVDPNAVTNTSEEMAALTESQNKLTADLAQANQTIKALTSKFAEQEKTNTEIKTALEKFSTDWQNLMGTSTATAIENTANVKLSKHDKLFSKLNLK